MAKDYRVKVFKSGNSLAVRLPKAIGLSEGEEMSIVKHRDGSFSFWPVADDKAAFLALSGRMSKGFMAEGRGDIEQPERDWSANGDAAAAA